MLRCEVTHCCSKTHRRNGLLDLKPVLGTIKAMTIKLSQERVNKTDDEESYKYPR